MSQSEYLRYYRAQRGGEIPVFRGGQSGAGLGDILRGIFRFLTPLALRGVQAFAGNAPASTRAGMSMAEAARSAIRPALVAAGGSGLSHVVDAVAPGLIPRSSQQSGNGTLFDGENGVPTTEKAIKRYKRSAAHQEEPADIPVAKRPAKRVGKHVREAHYNF